MYSNIDFCGNGCEGTSTETGTEISFDTGLGK